MTAEYISDKKWWQYLWFKLLIVFLGFSLMALLSSLQMSGQACLFKNKEIDYIQFLPINLIYFFCWGVLFFLVRELCLFISKRISSRFLMVFLHLGLGILFSLIHLFMFYKIIQLGVASELITIFYNYDLYTLIYRWLGSNMYIYIGMVGFFHFFYFYQQHREKELKASQLETQMAKIQLQSLKTQLRPHFLFNALNTISAYVKNNADTAIKMIARLSDLLRLTLETKSHLEIPLEEDLKIVHNYLEIEKLRFADRMEINLDIDPETMDALVPAMLLQPLVENAVSHGISRNLNKGKITIKAYKQKGNLELRVEDDGPGIDENNTKDNKMSHGIGLTNIRERLTKLYDDNFLMDMVSKKNQGFKVLITIPYKRA